MQCKKSGPFVPSEMLGAPDRNAWHALREQAAAAANTDATHLFGHAPSSVLGPQLTMLRENMVKNKSNLFCLQDSTDRVLCVWEKVPKIAKRCLEGTIALCEKKNRKGGEKEEESKWAREQEGFAWPSFYLFFL